MSRTELFCRQSGSSFARREVVTTKWGKFWITLDSPDITRPLTSHTSLVSLHSFISCFICRIVMPQCSAKISIHTPFLGSESIGACFCPTCESKHQTVKKSKDISFVSCQHSWKAGNMKCKKGSYESAEAWDAATFELQSPGQRDPVSVAFDPTCWDILQYIWLWRNRSMLLKPQGWEEWLTFPCRLQLQTSTMSTNMQIKQIHRCNLWQNPH